MHLGHYQRCRSPHLDHQDRQRWHQSVHDQPGRNRNLYCLTG
jgi:hypothetical protein